MRRNRSAASVSRNRLLTRAALVRAATVRERLCRILISALVNCALWFPVPAPAAEIKTDADAKWVEAAGGAVIRDPAGRITGVDLRASWVTDTDLRKLMQLPYL